MPERHEDGEVLGKDTDGCLVLWDGEHGTYKGVPKGVAVVEDAILPVLHTVPEKDIVDVKLAFDGEYDKYVQDDYKKAAAVSGKLKGVAVGKLFSIGVADGNAVYIVTATHGSTCDVEWRGYGGGDRYTDHYFGWGRKRVANSDVKRYVGWDDFCAKTFGKKEWVPLSKIG